MAAHNEQDKVLILEFLRTELMYDIKNLGYIIHDSAKKETSAEGKNVVDIAEDGNADRIQRLLDLAYAEVMRILSPYTDHEVRADSYGNDILNEPTVYFVYITMKHNMPGITENLLRTYIHEYMVAYVMAEWLAMVSPDQATLWANKVQALTETIKSALSARKSTVRIKQSPWG